jgi:hypothetical protein
MPGLAWQDECQSGGPRRPGGGVQGSIRAIIRHVQARRRCNLADHSVAQLHHGARVRVRRRVYELLHFQNNFPPLSRPTRRKGTPLGDSRLCPGCSSRRSHGSAEALDIPGAMSRYHPPASQVRPTRTPARLGGECDGACYRAACDSGANGYTCHFRSYVHHHPCRTHSMPAK